VRFQNPWFRLTARIMKNVPSHASCLSTGPGNAGPVRAVAENGCGVSLEGDLGLGQAYAGKIQAVG